MKRRRRVPHARLALALALAAVGPAAAHQPSSAYLRLVVDPGRALEGSLEVALRDLEQVIGLDGNGDGAITWGELKARHSAIAAYVRSRLELEAPAGRCELHPQEHLVDQRADGAYAVVRFTASCPAGASATKLRYRLLFDVDPLHRGLLTIVGHGAEATAVLSPSRQDMEL